MAALDTADRQEGELAQAKSVAAEGQDRHAARADAGVQGHGSQVARRAGPADLADRSGRAIHGDQRPGQRDRRLQRPDRRRRRAPPDRGPRRDQCRQRPRSAREHGAARPRPPWAWTRSMCWPTAATSPARRSWPARRLGVTPYVPKPLTSGAKAEGRFGKQDFVYVAEQDVYRCPAGQPLTRRMTTVEKGMTLHRYWDRASCADLSAEAPMHDRARSGASRAGSMRRSSTPCRSGWTARPSACASARATVEHPFGTIKAWMGATHFLTEAARERPNRDEPPRPGLQSEACDRHPRRPAPDRGHAGLIGPAIPDAENRNQLLRQTSAASPQPPSHTASVGKRTWPRHAAIAAFDPQADVVWAGRDVRFQGVSSSSTGQRNTVCSLLAGVSKPKVFRGR